MHFTNLKYPFLNFKRYIEQIIMFPFVLWGRLFWKRYVMNLILDLDYDIVFFYPSAGVGGAERTNADILEAVPEKRKLVIFTKKGDYDLNQSQLYSSNTDYVILADKLDEKKKYWNNLVWRGVLAQYIKKHQSISQVFIGQCNFGYKILPHLPSRLRVSELIHMLDAKFANVWMPFISYIDTRVVISEVIRKQFEDFYDQKKIPSKYKSRIRVIPNKIPFEIPSYSQEFSLPLNVIYVGRGGPQKRLWLLNRVIDQTQNLNLQYHLAGDFSDELPSLLPPNVKYYGKISSDEMPSFYKGKQVLLMTSAWEGFPFAIIESMINGIVPVVTAVDSIPEHIHDGENGFLIFNPEDEDGVVTQAVQILTKLVDSPDLYMRVSRNAYDYIVQNFDAESFDRSYQEVLN